MKIGISSYSFHQYLSAGKMSCMDVLDTAKDTGFEGVEFVEGYFPKALDSIAYAKELRKKADELGLDICCYSFGAELIKETAEEGKAEIARVKGQIDIAAALGAKLIRHDTMFSLKRFRSFDLCLPELREICREISMYAEKYGIRTMVENHGTICQGSDRVEKLFNAVDYPNFGLLVDIGNFLCADEAPAHAVAVTAPYAFHAHIKDFKIHAHSEGEQTSGFRTRACNILVGTAAGEGDVPVRQCIDILKRVGYDDYLVLEYEAEEDCMKGIKRGLKFIRECLCE